jgi:hypothetical protein
MVTIFTGNQHLAALAECGSCSPVSLCKLYWHRWQQTTNPGSHGFRTNQMSGSTHMQPWLSAATGNCWCCAHAAAAVSPGLWQLARLLAVLVAHTPDLPTRCSTG